MQTITQMSRLTFDELCKGIADGSAAEKLKSYGDIAAKDLPRKQRVEVKQLMAIRNLFDEGLLEQVRDNHHWSILYIKKDDSGHYFMELKDVARNIILDLRRSVT